jgi:hypothetical protein
MYRVQHFVARRRPELLPWQSHEWRSAYSHKAVSTCKDGLPKFAGVFRILHSCRHLPKGFDRVFAIFSYQMADPRCNRCRRPIHRNRNQSLISPAGELACNFAASTTDDTFILAGQRLTSLYKGHLGIKLVFPRSRKFNWCDPVIGRPKAATSRDDGGAPYARGCITSGDQRSLAHVGHCRSRRDHPEYRRCCLGDLVALIPNVGLVGCGGVAVTTKCAVPRKAKRSRPAANRNPVARALRALRPKIKPSGKLYRRRVRRPTEK